MSSGRFPEGLAATPSVYPVGSWAFLPVFGETGKFVVDTIPRVHSNSLSLLDFLFFRAGYLHVDGTR